jgi:CheY-like chemotaxis protein
MRTGPAVATLGRVSQPGSPDDAPTRFEPARFSFVAAGLREAVELAGELRQVVPADVRVRPARLARADRRSWVVLVLTPPLGTTAVRAMEDKLHRIALRVPGRTFLGRIQGNGVSAAPMRFVIIDDSEAFRETARGHLEAHGHRVLGEADTASAGFDAVERLRPDAVVLDVHLPDGSGLDLCTLLTGPMLAPAVLLVSNHDLEDTRVAEQWGARGFSLKTRLPHFDLDSLRS